MANKIIFIAGPSASGKSRYAEHLEKQFHMPVICKDSVMQKKHGSSTQEQKR